MSFKITQYFTLSVTLTVMLLITGCVSSEERMLNDARRYTAVSRMDPSFRPEIGDSLIWFSDIIYQEANSEIKATEEQKIFIKATIESMLIRKLYRITTDEAQADYMLAAAVLLDDSSESQEINELVQIYPNLADSFNDYERGSLLLIIVPLNYTQGSPILWRGVIQAYTLGDELPENVQLARLQGIVNRLVDAVPRAGD